MTSRVVTSEQDRRIKELESALRGALVVVNDWLVTYAWDMCNDDTVKETNDRIWDGGGKLWYITCALENIRAALNESKP